MADLITTSAAAIGRAGLKSAASPAAQSQCYELLRRSETGHLQQLALVHGTNSHHHFATSILL